MCFSASIDLKQYLEVHFVYFLMPLPGHNGMNFVNICSNKIILYFWSSQKVDSPMADECML
uniref:Uncharacterized protein n=1 Tax=Oryza nivara TaxID=4536 RepID=A0A0E0IQB3_ORYNI